MQSKTGKKPEYRLKLYRVGLGGKLQPADFRSVKQDGLQSRFVMLIERLHKSETAYGRGISSPHIAFTVAKDYFMIHASGQGKPSVDFYRAYKTTPFRALLYTLFTEAEKRGVKRFLADPGSRDRGISHRVQEAEGLFTHIGEHVDIHSTKDFPRITFDELQRALKEGRAPAVSLESRGRAEAVKRVRAKEVETFAGYDAALARERRRIAEMDRSISEHERSGGEEEQWGVEGFNAFGGTGPRGREGVVSRLLRRVRERRRP